MYRTVQLVLAGFLALLFGLSALSRRLPHTAWLQLSRYSAPQLSEEQRARMRQRANLHAGIELILLGIVVPMVYFASTVIMFNHPTALGSTIALASAAILVALGITAIWRNRRRQLPNRDLR
jgi:NADH:ubiquinone oxidoreductase subunit K